MLTLAHDVNALLLPADELMLAPQQPKRNHAQALAWAHFTCCNIWTGSSYWPIHNLLPQITIVWAYMVFISRMAAKQNTCIGLSVMRLH